MTPITSISPNKIQEALSHVKDAEKSLKTSFVKWKPDFDSAADEYNKAATCYKTVKSYRECRECLTKASDCYKQNRSYYSAAKCLDQAALISKEMGNLQDIAGLVERACQMLQEHGSPDTAVLSLNRGAKMIEKDYPERALRLYLKAADVVMIEDRPRAAAEYVSKAARTQIKLGLYDDAADTVRREIGLHQQDENLRAVGRLVVALVLIQLARGDQVAAEKAFKEWGNCCEGEEVQSMEMLLQAYNDEDANMASRALNSPFIKHMDVEYTKLARNLALPSGISQAVLSSTGLVNDEEEEGGLGLC